MHVLIGAEFGYDHASRATERYLRTQQTYKPDFTVNSVHTCLGTTAISRTTARARAAPTPTTPTCTAFWRAWTHPTITTSWRISATARAMRLTPTPFCATRNSRTCWTRSCGASSPAGKFWKSIRVPKKWATFCPEGHSGTVLRARRAGSLLRLGRALCGAHRGKARNRLRRAERDRLHVPDRARTGAAPPRADLTPARGGQLPEPPAAGKTQAARCNGTQLQHCALSLCTKRHNPRHAPVLCANSSFLKQRYSRAGAAPARLRYCIRFPRAVGALFLRSFVRTFFALICVCARSRCG